MANTFSVSDLQADYRRVLSNVNDGHPVYLTENAEIDYVVMTVKDFEEYEQIKAMYQLMQALNENNQ